MKEFEQTFTAIPVRDEDYLRETLSIDDPDKLAIDQTDLLERPEVVELDQEAIASAIEAEFPRASRSGKAQLHLSIHDGELKVTVRSMTVGVRVWTDHLGPPPPLARRAFDALRAEGLHIWDSDEEEFLD